MITFRSWAVYGMLAAIWAALIGWQTAEHFRVSRQLHNKVVDLAHSRTSTCGRLIRTTRFLRGTADRNRLEAALNALVDTNELRTVELLNHDEEVVAAAPQKIELPRPDQFDQGVCWMGDTAILKYPMDPGTNIEVVVPRETFTNFSTMSRAAASNNPAPPSLVATTNASTNRFRGRGVDLARGRPYWMTEDLYRTLLAKDTAQYFVVVMSTAPILAEQRNDLWIRIVIGLLGTVGLAGYAFAWRSMTENTELQLRLDRASEQNLHLKELSLTAAGLAHETRNPLNIIRGLAQIIAKQKDVSPEITTKSREIVDETDRVTSQLNEFINYSRPREVHRAATNLSAVASEVARALKYDIEEKKIQLEMLVEPVVIEADEQLLRQALFNLVLNAVQAVAPNGLIRIRASRRSNEEAFIEVSDNGPGVLPEHRAEIFKPYFTTHEEGTGLGLSVVQQIVLAHGWEIQCLSNEPVGALFRISHVRIK